MNMTESELEAYTDEATPAIVRKCARLLLGWQLDEVIALIGL